MDDDDLRSGVWMAWDYGDSGGVPFATEVEARRYAMSHETKASWVKWGEKPQDD